MKLPNLLSACFFGGERKSRSTRPKDAPLSIPEKSSSKAVATAMVGDCLTGRRQVLSHYLLSRCIALTFKSQVFVQQSFSRQRWLRSLPSTFIKANRGGTFCFIYLSNVHLIPRVVSFAFEFFFRRRVSLRRVSGAIDGRL